MGRRLRELKAKRASEDRRAVPGEGRRAARMRPAVVACRKRGASPAAAAPAPHTAPAVGECGTRDMRSQDGAGEPGEVAEPGLALTVEAAPGADEEPAAAEAEETPGGDGRCWLCRSSPCCSRAEPGEYALQTRVGLRLPTVSPLPSPPGRSGKPATNCLVPGWAAEAEAPARPAGAETGESFVRSSVGGLGGGGRPDGTQGSACSPACSAPGQRERPSGGGR